MVALTLDLDAETEARLDRAAREAGIPKSRFVADLIREKFSAIWPAELAALAGSWGNDFPELEEIRAGLPSDAPRR